MAAQRTIVHDFIATISGDGWRYPQARVLTDTDGDAAIFTQRSGGPVKTLHVGSGGRINPARGKVETDTDGLVQWRRRGSSCSWPLAKCRIQTNKLAEQWPQELEVTPEVVEEPETVEPSNSEESEPANPVITEEQGEDIQQRFSPGGFIGEGSPAGTDDEDESLA